MNEQAVSGATPEIVGGKYSPLWLIYNCQCTKCYFVDATPPFNYKLDSFVSHKGTSVHCGHYVSHVYKNGEWVLFNDNKVAVTPNPPIGEAYLYFLKRQQ